MHVQCHLTGADSKYVDSSAKWVSVPEVMLSPPVYNPLGAFEQCEGLVDRSKEERSEGRVKEERGDRSMSVDEPTSSSSASSSLTIENQKENKENEKGEKRSSRVRQATQAQSSRSRHTDHPVALEMALLKVAAASETAFRLRQKHEVSEKKWRRQ